MKRESFEKESFESEMRVSWVTSEIINSSDRFDRIIFRCSSCHLCKHNRSEKHFLLPSQRSSFEILNFLRHWRLFRLSMSEFMSPQPRIFLTRRDRIFWERIARIGRYLWIPDLIEIQTFGKFKFLGDEWVPWWEGRSKYFSCHL